MMRNSWWGSGTATLPDAHPFNGMRCGIVPEKKP
jgi:hypothetical protein